MYIPVLNLVFVLLFLQEESSQHLEVHTTEFPIVVIMGSTPTILLSGHVPDIIL